MPCSGQSATSRATATRREWSARLAGLALALLTGPAVTQVATERQVQIQLGRGTAQIPATVLTHPAAEATLILLPGGNAGPGERIDDKPTSRNFLARSRALFAARGFHVVVAFRPTDLRTLDTDYRHGAAHIAELEKVVTWAQSEFNRPVWLIGTSRGTVSAAAATLALRPGRIAGLVLTSSITASRLSGAVPTQALERISVPTLVVHHRRDACRACVPDDAARMVERLQASPARGLLLIDGGANPTGDPCEALHWHGYIGYEAETVRAITAWIKAPRTASLSLP